MQDDNQGSDIGAPENELESFFWECPKCQTINTDVACEACGLEPEYYLPIDPDELELVDLSTETPGQTQQPEKRIHPEEPEIFLPQGKIWKCVNCQTINDERHTICRKCAAGKPRRKTSALTWLLVAIGIMIIVVAYVGLTTQDDNSFPLKLNSPGSSSSTSQSSTSRPAEAISRVYPNPPQDGCVLWTSVSIDDAGQTICVYGLVQDSYAADSKRYFLRFSDEKNSFRMVLMNGIKMESSAGECVYQTGEIKEFSGVLYMEFSTLPMNCEQ